MNKFEKLIEYIINDEDQKARELFHSIVVEKSRDIYESIVQDEMEESVHGDMTEINDQIADEEAMGEDEDFTLDGGDTDGDTDGVSGDLPANPMDGEPGGEPGEHADLEDKVMSIDAKVDELLAKFDDIIGGGDDFGGSNDAPADGMSDGPIDGPTDGGPEEENPIAEGEQPEWLKKGSGKSGSAQSGKSGSAQSGKSGSAQSGKSGSGKMESRKLSTVELMREYVDTIGDIYGGQGDATEGDAVGAAGKKSPINAKSVSKQEATEFGGTSENIVSKRGATNENPDGKPVPKANNEYTKGQGEIKSGNVNVPGGKAGSPKSTGHEYTKDAKGAEGQTTSGKLPVATKSVQVQNTGKK